MSDETKEQLQAEIDRAGMDLIIGLLMWKEQIAFAWWKWVHNFIVHPMMAWPGREPEWLGRLHDWTGAKCWGAG